MTEDQLVYEFAWAWNALDPERIITHLATDAVYESQHVLEPLRGREAIAEYLHAKMTTIRAHPDAAVRAEVGRVGDQRDQPLWLGFGPEMNGRPCVLVQQGAETEPSTLVLLDVADGWIRRIDLCTVAPVPAAAHRTGTYPGLARVVASDELRSPARAHRPAVTDAGQRAVERLYQLSNTDATWSVRHPRGFTWWAGPLAQHVWADPPTDVHDKRLFRVHTRTDMIAGFSESERHLTTVGTVARMSTLSSWIRHPQDPTRIQLAAAVSVHEEVEDFLTRLIALAAAIQVAEAHIIAPTLESVPGWSIAASAHPSSGPREDLDDMLNVIKAMVAPIGQGDSRWAGPEMEEALQLLQGPPCVLTTGDAQGVAAEFPFPGPGGTSLLRLQTTERHPRLGNGCLASLSLPHGARDAASASLALTLNELELAGDHYSVGSWCSSEHGVTYVSFLPNAAHQPRALVNIVMSLVGRVRWVTRDVFGYDLEEHYEETLARKLNSLGG